MNQVPVLPGHALFLLLLQIALILTVSRLLAEGVKRLTGIRVEVGRELKKVTYSVTRHRVELRAHVARALSGTLKPGPCLTAANWIEPGALPDLTLGAAARRLAAWINRDPGHISWS